MEKNQPLLKRLTNLLKPFMFGALVVMGNTTNSVFAQDWNEIIKAVASDRALGDKFGCSVAISGDYAIVGANSEDEDATGGNTVDNAGSAYIFKNNAGTWTEVQKIVASDREVNDDFGFSVAISGDYAIVGAARENNDATGGDSLHSAGSAYIFKNDTGTWTEVQKIVASDRALNVRFGRSVAISGDYAIVGAHFEEKDAAGGNSLYSAGSAYIFKNIAGTWTEVQKIVASDREGGDYFGYSVAISGDYVLVGAIFENEDATGGNSLYRAGSAYIFKNSAGTWSEVQKIVASDREAHDQFGYSVAISGDYAIVSAPEEREDITGGNSLYKAGSAYIFKNNAETWTEVQKIAASDRETWDQFGYSVAISGDYVKVGARFQNHDPTGGDSLYRAGSAYIFKNISGTWTEVQKIAASDREAGDQFGNSVAISGDFVIVGALFEGGNTLDFAGSAYIFKNSPDEDVGIVENSFGNNLTVYPNPTNGKFSIDLGADYENVQIYITDISGRLIESKTMTQSQVLNLSINEPTGIYIVSIQAANKKVSIKLVKK